MPLLRRDEPATNAPFGLEPIRIATDELVLVGFVAPTGQRVTDMLLRGHDLAFLPAGADAVPDAWIAVAPADVLWVVPPPLPPRPGWRPSRAEARLFVRVGRYRVIGSAHVPPEVPIDHRLATSHPFLPLTAASIATDGAGAPEDVDVAIVNLSRSTEQRPIPAGA